MLILVINSQTQDCDESNTQIFTGIVKLVRKGNTLYVFDTANTRFWLKTDEMSAKDVNYYDMREGESYRLLTQKGEFVKGGGHDPKQDEERPSLTPHPFEARID